MRQCRGFTMVELLVATVILGVLAAIAVVSLMSGFEKARQRATMADMRSIAGAIGSYEVDNNTTPAGATIADLAGALVPRYISALPTADHWTHPLAYESDGTGYSLESFGKDGVPGADISLSTRFDFDLDIVLVDGAFVAAPE